LPQALGEHRVAHDGLELDLLGIEQLQPQVVVTVPPVKNEACAEEAELVELGYGLVHIGHRRQVDVGVGDADMLNEQVPGLG
jgi:hypothetical protein